MFWKNVKYYLSSIRIRLALLYSLSALILLLLIAAFLYWESLNILHKANYQFLSNELETIRYLLNQPEIDHAAVKKLVIDIPSDTDNSVYRYFVRIVNDKGQAMLETPGIEIVLPTRPYIGSFTLFNKPYYGTFSRDKHDYILIQAPISANRKYPKGEIQIALDVTHQHQIVEDRKLIFNSFLFITLCAFLLGLYLSQKGMQSLYTLTETTRKISVDSLSKRINPKHWPYELRQLGVSFNQMLNRIESSIIHLKQFSADLAHELRTPINNLIGQTEIALSYSHSVDEYQQVMSSNLEELHRISQLIENILFLARAEDPETNIEKTKINVRDEIMIVQEYYDALLQEKSIQVTCNGNAHIYANSIMFRRIINNLLSNAIKYIDHNGLIEFDVFNKDDNVYIEIRDNGIGIDEHHLPKIFERFYRIDNDRSQQTGGTGLGLAIVKTIVELHKGKISISSKPAIGTRFLLEFPIT